VGIAFRGRMTVAKDPVCGMEVDEKSADQTSLYKGTTYYFCSAGCKKAFQENPEKYAKK
jgi:Cu+-exporting ATPase